MPAIPSTSQPSRSDAGLSASASARSSAQGKGKGKASDHLVQPDARRQVRPFGMASPEEYIPTESDFDTIINFEFDGPASASTSASGSSSSAYQIDDQHPFEDYPLPQPPNTDNYDPLAPATKARMRRRRVQQQVVEALPPLPVGEVPEEGRYDWRPRSASAIRQAELDYARRWGKRKVKLSAATGTATRRDRWFPDKEVWRKAAKMEKLGEGDRYFDELARYRAQ